MTHRTPEQVTADDNLTEAIDQVHRAYYGEPDGVLTKYVVIAQRRHWDDTGLGFTTQYSTPMGDDVPIADLLGLVEYAATRYRHVITSEDI